MENNETTHSELNPLKEEESIETTENRMNKEIDSDQNSEEVISSPEEIETKETEKVENSGEEDNRQESENDGEDEDLFKNEETYDDEGELSELAANDVTVEGSGNASIVGSQIIIGGTPEEDDTVYPCPNCQVQIDASKYGKITCENCGFNIYRRNLKLNINQFETIEDNSIASDYHNVIARINNNFIRKRFVDSFKYCKQAEELAPREPTTWEYYTIVEFYHEMGYPKGQRKEINDILRTVRDNIKICEANNVHADKIEEIKGEIGIYLFNLAKSKIGSFYSKSRKQKGYWSKKGRHLTINYLKLFEDCFRLTKDPIYLKGYVDELSKPFKWIVRGESGELINLPACGKRFNAVFQRERVIKRIERIEPDYEAPEVENARLDIYVQKPDKPDNETGIINISFQ